MSGYPKKEQVRDLVEIERGRAKLCESIAQHHQSLKEMERSIERMTAQHHDMTTRRDQLLMQMDCHAPGNAGYEERMMTLIHTLATFKD